MTGKPAGLLEQALKLPAEERARLAEDLLQSIHPAGDDLTREEWRAVFGEGAGDAPRGGLNEDSPEYEDIIMRRISDIQSGGARTSSWEEVRERILAKHHR
jgi:hypothetical protein